ncbi:MAG: methyl-accepting chemotaxis protein [Desulfobulbaceae bacterium]|nr:MAG: methyl-accepting chemotaxis protein [Desulfobulbaceae bacterium]
MSMSIGKKLNINTLTLSIIALSAFLVMGVSAVLTARDSFIQNKFEQFSSIREIKKNQIEGFFRERQGDMEVLVAMVGALQDQLDSPGDLAARYGALLDNYKETYGYYDLFLIDAQGHCFYSAAKEADYQTNLLTGPYRNSNLGQLVRRVMESRSFEMADFAPYAPSNDEPAAFVAHPLIKNGSVQMVVALQIPLTAVNSIMQERTGMGKTGETYLVGPDNLMRSDSFLDPENHSVAASFADPSRGKVETEAVRAALAGRSGEEIIIDYNGNPVLSAYTPVTLNGLTWALLAEIDEQEVRSESVAARNLMHRVLIIGTIAIMAMLACILFNFFIIRGMVLLLSRISNGLNDGASQVSSSAGQVAGSGQELADGAAEQAASLEETSSSLDEISSMTKQNADNAGMADTLMRDTGGIVQKAADAMSELTTSMEQINSASTETQKIVKTIDEIAFQTNLLALNAAVEAARAGEAGAGFAVVADEVRNLAMRAAEAAKDTAVLIDETVSRVGQGSSLVHQTNSTFAEVATSTEKAAGLVGEIAAASGEQAQGIGQLNQAMSEMDTVVQRTAANSEESAAAAEELSAMASQMMDYVGELLALVEGGSAAQATMGNQPLDRQLQQPTGAARHRPAAQPATAPKKQTAALSAPAAPATPKPQPEKKEEAAKAIPFDDDDFEDF